MKEDPFSGWILPQEKEQKAQNNKIKKTQWVVVKTLNRNVDNSERWIRIWTVKRIIHPSSITVPNTTEEGEPLSLYVLCLSFSFVTFSVYVVYGYCMLYDIK